MYSSSSLFTQTSANSWKISAMSAVLPISFVTIQCNQLINQKISSLTSLKPFSLRHNALNKASTNVCKSTIRASDSAISSVTVEKNTSHGTVFVIRAQDKTGLPQAITRVLQGLKIEKATMEFDEKEDYFVIKFMVTDSDGNKIEDKESLIRIENALMEAINGGEAVVVTLNPLN